MEFNISQQTEDNCNYLNDERSVQDPRRNVTLDFGRVPVGTTVTKSFKISNDCRDEQLYEVHRDPLTHSLDTVVFNFHKYSWSLRPKECMICQVSYRPISANRKCVDYFSIVKCYDTVMKVTARGESIGPKAVISMDNREFTCSAPGRRVKKRLKISNDSDCPANFIFDIDYCHNYFKPDPSEGRVDARSHKYIVVTFAPTNEGHHFFDLPCLIHHQPPIMIPLNGFCGKCCDKEIECDVQTLELPLPTDNGFESYMSDSKRYYRIHQTDPIPKDPVSISNIYLDFGSIEAGPQNASVGSTKTTSFTNHTETNMSIEWNRDDDEIFTVEDAILKARGSCLFEIRFEPTEEDTFYTRDLTASVFWIIDKDSVPKYSFCMNVSIRVIGHTFVTISSNWIPQYDVPRTVIMPPCFPLTPVYATFLIKKFGQLPLMFRFISPHETRFTVKPMVGIIYNDYQVIVVEMFPKGDDKMLLYERWAIRFNGNPKYEVSVDFRGYAEYPELNFSKDIVKFPSAHPDCDQVEQMATRNASRHCINYRFYDIPDELSVNPTEGEICSNEILVHTWSFHPTKEGDYQFDVFLHFHTDANNSEKPLRLLGKCEMGHLLVKCSSSDLAFYPATPRELNFGEQIYGDHSVLSFELHNPSTVGIPYILSHKYRGWPYEGKYAGRQLLIEPSSGILPPGLQEKIKIANLLHHGTGLLASKYVLSRLLNIEKLNAILNDLQPGETGDLDIDFPPTYLQNEKSTIRLLISNPTSADVTWAIKPVKICSSKKSEKRNPTFKRNSLQRNLCTFVPKSGILKAGEKATIAMELLYTILGETKLKFDLSIGYDRHLHLNIKIIVVSEADDFGAVALYGPRVELKKTFIGRKDPVSQACWIYNPTKTDIVYTVDTATVCRANDSNNSEIFCLNPSGIVRAYSYHPILIKFCPRRRGTFQFTVPLLLGTKKTEITIVGESTDDPACETLTMVNSTQFTELFPITEVPVYFNVDHIKLSPSLTHSTITNMIIIHNCYEHDVIAYNWKRYELPGVLKISVEPESGRIQPGALHTFRLVVVTGGKSCSLSVDVICEFINQSQKRDYEKSVIMQESLREEAQYYFIITEKGMSVPKLENVVLEAPKPFHRVLTVSCCIYGLRDEDLIPLEERIKNTPPAEITIEKQSNSRRLCIASPEIFDFSKLILENMIWDILRSTNICKGSNSVVKYSQIALNPIQRKRTQSRSYVRPPPRTIERLLEHMIFTIIHKEFSLDTKHLTPASDARQMAYQKMWQQVPNEKELE